MSNTVDVTLERLIDDKWVGDDPPQVVQGVMKELAGEEKKLGAIYFAKATHSIVLPFSKRIAAGKSRCIVDGKHYEVGGTHNVADACQTLVAFVCEMAP